MKKPLPSIIINTKQPKRAAGYLPVIAAFFGNLTVTIFKFIAFAISGSSAMFSEAVHNLADTSNQVLLFIGIKKSTNKPSKKFEYGFGSERFLWALLSACGILFIGAGVTIYKGIDSIMHARALEFSPIVIFVLTAGFIIESGTLLFAIHEIRKQHPNKKFSKAVKVADPSTLGVLYEDSVAVLGNIIALISIYLTHITGNHLFDAAGSIVIGLLLGIAAIILINKNRQMLLGQAMPENMKKEIIELLTEDPSIEQVLDFKSSTLDYGVYRIKCEIEFNGYHLLYAILKEDSLRDEYEDITKSYEDFLKFCVYYSDLIGRLMGKKIDEIEQEIKNRFPGVQHIDLEVN